MAQGRVPSPILCPVSHIIQELIRDQLKTIDSINQSVKSVFYKFKPSQCLHFKYSVLHLTYSLEKPYEAQSQFVIN